MRRGRRTFQHISPSLHLKLVLLPLPFTHCWPQFEELLFFFSLKSPLFPGSTLLCLFTLETDSIFFFHSLLRTLTFVTLPFPFVVNFSIFFRVSKFTKLCGLHLEKRQPLAICAARGPRKRSNGGRRGRLRRRFLSSFSTPFNPSMVSQSRRKERKKKCDSRCVREPIPRGTLFLLRRSRQRWPAEGPFGCRRFRKEKKTKKSFL